MPVCCREEASVRRIARAFSGTLAIVMVALLGFGCETAENTVIDTHFCHAERGFCSQVVIEEISRATSTIECAVYTFTLEPIAEALADAAERGVQVWVVIETDQEAPPVTAILQQNGVYLRKDGNGDLMHHKFMVVDGRTVVTGSPVQLDLQRGQQTRREFAGDRLFSDREHVP